MGREGEFRKEKEVTFGHRILYLCSNSYWSLWVYWSPVCVTRETFFSLSLLKAQRRQNHPSHQSPKHSDPLSPVSSLLLYCIFDSDLFAAMSLGLILSPQFESSGRRICHTFAAHRKTYHWAQFITSSLLLPVTSKGPARSFSVFKTRGHNREAGSSLIYPISTYSLLKETKVNPHLPQIDQTHGDLVND